MASSAQSTTSVWVVSPASPWSGTRSMQPGARRCCYCTLWPTRWGCASKGSEICLCSVVLNHNAGKNVLLSIDSSLLPDIVSFHMETTRTWSHWLTSQRYEMTPLYILLYIVLHIFDKRSLFVIISADLSCFLFRNCLFTVQEAWGSSGTINSTMPWWPFWTASSSLKRRWRKETLDSASPTGDFHLFFQI